jgi:transcriptional regulator of heat shock response
MKFTREVFYPALCNASKNIEDATMFIGSISTVMMEKFLQLMKEKKFSELKLTDSLDPKDEKYNELKEMLDLFNDMSVFDARTYFEGMKSEISLFIQEENKDRPLSDLKTKWLDQE